MRVEALERRALLSGTLPGAEGFNLVDPSLYQLTFGGFRYVRSMNDSTGSTTKKYFSQAVTIKNVGSAVLGGPLSLEVRNLSLEPIPLFNTGGGSSNGIFSPLINANGDVGSPNTVYVNFDTPNGEGTLAPSESATAVLQFRHDHGPTPITYATVVKQGDVTVLEAESAARLGAVVDTIHTGFTGTGFVDYVNTSNDYIEWTYTAPSAGSYMLDFRYALGALPPRTLAMTVNGISKPQLAFGPTQTWTNWQKLSVQTDLVVGANLIRLTANGSNGPNIDHLAVEKVTPLKYFVDGAETSVDPDHPLQFGGGDENTTHTLTIVNTSSTDFPLNDFPLYLGTSDAEIIQQIINGVVEPEFVPATRSGNVYTILDSPHADAEPDTLTFKAATEFYFLAPTTPLTPQTVANPQPLVLAKNGGSVSVSFRVHNAGNLSGTGGSAGTVLFDTQVYVPQSFPNPEINLTMMKHGTLGKGTVVQNGALEVNFGTIPRGTVIAPRNFQIKNVGTNGLKVTSTIFSKNTPHFAVTSQPKTSGGAVYTLGGSIAANDFVQFQIRMDTSTAGAKAAFIEFTNNDFANPYDGNGAATRFRFKLIGTVTASAAPVAAAPVIANRPVVISRPAQGLLRPPTRKPAVWNDANGGG